ncbi:MAG TPA: YetF domain-containing protein [Euzebya sp.]|nr:YetF domain-containing protein [Euzebya sp.]
MMVGELLGASWGAIAATALATIAIYATVILGTRLYGLRTFAKMSSFDFAATIATGSILASVALTSAPLVLGLVAVAVLLSAQQGVAILRRRQAVHRVVDNSPLLLMDGPAMLEDNMRASDVTADDIFAKLREANVTRLDQVRYVVLETTGDVSVLHGASSEGPADEELLRGVVRDAGTRWR